MDDEDFTKDKVEAMFEILKREFDSGRITAKDLNKLIRNRKRLESFCHWCQFRDKIIKK